MRSNYLTKSILSLCAALGLLGITAFKDISVNRTKISNEMATASDAVIMREFKNVEFDFDKSVIRLNDHQLLDSIADLLLDHNAVLKLGGHADSIGPYVYNWHLSKSRADEVKSYLVSKGVEESRISSTEFGNTQPIASNETEEGRQKNRRVEIALVE